MTFTVQTPPADQMGQDVVASLRVGDDPVFRGRAVRVYVVLDCHGGPSCAPGPGGQLGGPARAVWVVLYPDCTDASKDIGWVVVDAIKGLDGGSMGNEPC